MLRRVPLWVWWIPVVWIVSVPWRGLPVDPAWSGAHWIPFKHPADRPSDFLLNCALFAPFGFSFLRGRGTRALWIVAPAAAAVSLSAELLQLFGAVRYPSGTDIVAAVLGSLAGGGLALGIRKKPFDLNP